MRCKFLAFSNPAAGKDEEFEAMFDAFQQGRIPMSDCFDLSSAFVGLFEPITDTMFPRK